MSLSVLLLMSQMLSGERRGQARPAEAGRGWAVTSVSPPLTLHLHLAVAGAGAGGVEGGIKGKMSPL